MYSRKVYLDALLGRRNNHLIKVITGARRVGKSFLMNDIFYRSLLERGVAEDHIVKFAFDRSEDQDKLDSYFPELSTRIYVKKDQYVINSKKFRAYIKDQTKEGGAYVFLLDEIQLLEDFVGTLNGYVADPDLDVYVTGSNSRLLSSDIDTRFRGRGSVLHVLPLSFGEYLEGREGGLNDAYASYAATGGIPLVASLSKPEDQLAQLRSIANETYFKDIVDRYGVRGVSDLEELFRFLASNISALVSPTKLANAFKSIKGKDITDDTLSSYLRYFEDAFILKRARIHDLRGKKIINSPFKEYFEDIGIRNAVIGSFGNDAGRMLENIVFNELRYRGYEVSTGRITYSEKSKEGSLSKIDGEIDFVAEKGYERIYVQVCLNATEEVTYAREMKSFDKIGDSFRKVLLVKDGLLDRVASNGVHIVDVLRFLSGEAI